jgi:hypothetical protein
MRALLNPHTTSGFGRLSQADPSKPFNGVKVFSATMVGDREVLGEKISTWLAANPKIEPIDAIVTQSSDDAFHCIAITVFFWEEL